MSLFDLFRSKNLNELNGQDEKQAAKLLYNIFQEDKKGNDVDNLIDKLSANVYYLAFKRTSKKLVTLEEAFNPLGNFNDLAASMKISMRYSSIYKTIKKAISETCKNKAVINSSVSLSDCEISVVMLLQTAAKMINEL